MNEDECTQFTYSQDKKNPGNWLIRGPEAEDGATVTVVTKAGAEKIEVLGRRIGGPYEGGACVYTKADRSDSAPRFKSSATATVKKASVRRAAPNDEPDF